MPIDIDNINRETNVSEDEELRVRQRQRLHKITAEELRSGPQGVNIRMQSLDDIAPNVAQACQWVIPPAVKNFWQASSQAYISDMMGNAMGISDGILTGTWRYVDGTERPDDTSNS